MTSYTYDEKLYSLIYASLRKINGYDDISPPEPDKIADARVAYNNIADALEGKGIRLFQKRWRTKTFSDNQYVTEDSQIYRCILGHTSSSDSKPGVGDDWTTYWVTDDSQETASAWVTATAYTCPGDFELASDELSIEKAFIRYSRVDTKVDIVRDQRFADIESKWLIGFPDELYIENTAKYTQRARIHPIPINTGADGYILHYQCVIKNENFTANGDLSFPDHWFKALTYMLASDLGPEYSLEDSKQRHLDYKANLYLAEAMKFDKPRSTRRIIKSCY